jgi:hypothetical protein
MPAFSRGLVAMSKDGAHDLELREVWSGDVREEFSAATRRIIAYFADECSRNLDKLLAHFTGDAEVVTPDGVYRGRDAIAAVYRKSFSDFPRLSVDVKAGFVGGGAHCYEYRAVLSDAADNDWLIEGINLMKLEGGLISSLRSFEDAPRRISAGGHSK